MAFKPGESGNPGGRPKEAAEVKALARSHCVEAITTLVRLMRSEDEKVAKAASDSLLDRGIGKPAQVIIGDVDEDPVQVSGCITLVKPGSGS
jgi:HEAT repeat protein